MAPRTAVPLGRKGLSRSGSLPSDLAGISVNGAKASSLGNAMQSQSSSRSVHRKRASQVKPEHPPRWFSDSKGETGMPCEERKFGPAVSETKAAFPDYSQHVAALAAPATVYSMLRARELERVQPKQSDSQSAGSTSGLPGPQTTLSEQRTTFRSYSAQEIANARTISPQLEEIQRVKDKRERVLQQRAAAFAKAHGVANPLQKALVERGDKQLARSASAPAYRAGSTDAELKKAVAARLSSTSVAAKGQGPSQRKPLTLKELLKDDGLRKQNAQKTLSDVSSSHRSAGSAVSDESPVRHEKDDTTILVDQKAQAAQGEIASVEETIGEAPAVKRSIVPELKAMIAEYKKNRPDDEDRLSSRSTAATSRSAVSTARSCSSLGSGIAAASSPSVASDSAGRGRATKPLMPASLGRGDRSTNITRAASTGRIETLRKTNPAAPGRGYCVANLIGGRAPATAAAAKIESTGKFQYSWNNASTAAAGGNSVPAARAKVAMARRERPASAGAARKPAMQSEAPRGAAYVHCKVVPDVRAEPAAEP